MTSSLYITTIEPRCGKSMVSLGICNLLLRKTGRVGVFRPIINRKSTDDRDKNINLLIQQFGLKINYEDTFALYEQDAASLLGQGKMDVIIDTVIQKYKALEAQFDFVLIIGSDFESEESAFGVDINAQIAKNLGSPVLIVSRGDMRKVSDVQNAIRVAYDTFIHAGCEVAGLIVNRVDPENLDILKTTLPSYLNDQSTFISVVPANERLSSPTIREVAEQLDAEVLYGEEFLGNLAYHYLIISMNVRNYLLHLKENALLITAGDQDDILLSAIQAHQSRNYPRLSGIILTGDLRPPASVVRLIDGLPDLFPILLVKPLHTRPPQKQQNCALTLQQITQRRSSWA